MHYFYLSLNLTTVDTKLYFKCHSCTVLVHFVVNGNITHGETKEEKNDGITILFMFKSLNYSVAPYPFLFHIY